MKYVAKEFQTGLLRSETAKQAIEELSKVQDRLNRSLHPVALGGSRHRDVFNDYFDKYTIVDSRPFMTAVNRRAIYARPGPYSEIFTPTAPDESIDKLLQSNIRECRERYK